MSGFCQMMSEYGKIQNYDLIKNQLADVTAENARLRDALSLAAKAIMDMRYIDALSLCNSAGAALKKKGGAK